MFLWIFWEFLSSLAWIYWKKALSYNTWLSSFGFMLLGWTIPFLLVIWITGFYNISFFPTEWDWNNVLLIFIITTTYLIREPLRQFTIKREKISVLLPYSKLNTVLSIILSFYLFWDVSFISFIIAIIIVVLITIFSIDFSSFKVPKTLWVFLIHEIILTWWVILIGYMLSSMEFLNFYVLLTNVTVACLCMHMIFTRGYYDIIRQSKAFYITRIWAATLGTGGYFLSLYIMSQLWVIPAILLSFLWLVFLIVLSFLILWDRPAIKSIFLWSIVTILVWIAFYFK